VSGPSTYEPKSGITRWLDRRLPIIRLAHDSFVAYPTPRNLNYWWTFGAHPEPLPHRADRHRHRAGHALHAARARVRVGERIMRDVILAG
jgi:hypothetical protein